jgi:hypothetical protein
MRYNFVLLLLPLLAVSSWSETTTPGRIAIVGDEEEAADAVAAAAAAATEEGVGAKVQVVKTEPDAEEAAERETNK